eukprot:COSAG02_NODE_42383_length_385_cov_0.678322_2_plen_68_part_01
MVNTVASSDFSCSIRVRERFSALACAASAPSPQHRIVRVPQAAAPFFKQKTAYEMESRDWSSDVCSSD